MTDKSPTRMSACACGMDHDAGLTCEGLSDTGLRGRVETAVLRSPTASTRPN